MLLANQTLRLMNKNARTEMQFMRANMHKAIA